MKHSLPLIATALLIRIAAVVVVVLCMEEMSMIHAFHQTIRLRRYHHHYQHHHRGRFVNNDAVTSSMSLSSIPQGPTTTSLFLKSRGTTSTRTTAKLFMSTDQNQNQMIQRTVGVGSHVSEMEVKKSRFIGYTKHVENWDQAQTYIEQVKLEHPKARHWCFGFRCGTNPIQERCSDDGEPTGTAGVPILGAIKGEDLSDTVVVVVRYFGGIKLGAGGLIRAYGAAARLVLREAPIDTLIPKSTFKVKVDSQHIGSIYESVAAVSGLTSGEEYGNDGSLTVTVTCDLEVCEQLREGLRDATRGSASFPGD